MGLARFHLLISLSLILSSQLVILFLYPSGFHGVMSDYSSPSSPGHDSDPESEINEDLETFASPSPSTTGNLPGNIPLGRGSHFGYQQLGSAYSRPNSPVSDLSSDDESMLSDNQEDNRQNDERADRLFTEFSRLWSSQRLQMRPLLLRGRDINNNPLNYRQRTPSDSTSTSSDSDSSSDGEFVIALRPRFVDGSNLIEVSDGVYSPNSAASTPPSYPHPNHRQARTGHSEERDHTRASYEYRQSFTIGNYDITYVEGGVIIE